MHRRNKWHIIVLNSTLKHGMFCFYSATAEKLKKKQKKKTIKWTAIVKFCFIRKPAIAGFNSIPEQINF